MKKLLTILLVLLVAGFAFAAGEELAGGDATLTLKADMGQKTNHGFYGSGNALTDAGLIFDMVSPDDTVEDLDLENDSAQGVGYYSFASTSSLGVNIVISGTPLTLAVSGGDTYYVPFEVAFNKLDENGSSASVSNVYENKVFKFDSVGDIDGLSPSISSSTYVSTASKLALLSANGVTDTKWATYELDVTFAGSKNIAFGLPEGQYVGTVVAEIVAD